MLLPAFLFIPDRKRFQSASLILSTVAVAVGGVVVSVDVQKTVA